jgi:MFS family permease
MRVALAAVWAVLLAAGIVQTANGLQTDLLSLRAGLEAFPAWSIGVVMAGYYVGYSCGPLFSPAIIRKLGQVNTIALGGVTAGVVIAIHGLFVTPVAWTLLRAISGFALASVYVGYESWINDKVVNRYRGRVFSLYMVLQMIGMTLSQVLITVASPRLLTLFLLAAILFFIGTLPVFAARHHAPAHAPPEPFGLIHLYRISPLGVIVTMLSGVSWSVVFTFGPIYAQREGFDLAGIGFYMGLAMATGAIVQFPLGWLSDAIGRRLSIGIVTGVAACAALFGLWAARHGTLAQDVASALIGGFAFPIYSLTAAHTNDSIASQSRVPAAAGLVLLFGLGSIVGPLATGWAITAMGLPGYFVVLAASMIAAVAVAAATR